MQCARQGLSQNYHSSKLHFHFQGKLAQPGVSEGKLAQPSVSEGKLAQPSVSEGKLV